MAKKQKPISTRKSSSLQSRPKPSWRSVARSVLTDIRAIIVAIIGSVIVAYLIQDARFAPKEEILQQPTQTLALNFGSGSINIRQGQMVVLGNDNSIVVVRFIFSADGAAYQWRHKRYDSDNISTGSGRLFENYARTPTANGDRVVDLGSSLAIAIEDFNATWSFSGPTSGWLYYKSLGILVLDDDDFNKIDLSKIRLEKNLSNIIPSYL